MNITHPSTSLVTIPHAFAFSTKLFEFDLIGAPAFFEEKYFDSEIDDKMKTGFTKFLASLNLYLDQLFELTSIDKSRVNIFGSITLENGAIMCAINRYYNKPWFSNVSIRMNPDESCDYVSDQGICYGQVIEHFINLQSLIINLIIIIFLGFINSKNRHRRTKQFIESRTNSVV